MQSETIKPLNIQAYKFDMHYLLVIVLVLVLVKKKQDINNTKSPQVRSFILNGLKEIGGV